MQAVSKHYLLVCQGAEHVVRLLGEIEDVLLAIAAAGRAARLGDRPRCNLFNRRRDESGNWRWIQRVILNTFQSPLMHRNILDLPAPLWPRHRRGTLNCPARRWRLS